VPAKYLTVLLLRKLVRTSAPTKKIDESVSPSLQVSPKRGLPHSSVIRLASLPVAGYRIRYIRTSTIFVYKSGLTKTNT
jgi:hypothetical protein